MTIKQHSMPGMHDIHAFADGTQEHSTITEFREYAAAIYKRLPAPTPNDKEWKQAAMPLIVWSALTTRQVAIPVIALEEEGILICGIHDFVIRYPELAYRYIFARHNEQWQKRILSSLVEVAWNKGVVLLVKAGVQRTEPIDLGSLCQYYDTLLIEKIVIIVQEGASVTINDTVHASSIASAYVIRSLDVYGAAHANVTIVSDYNLPLEVVTSSRTTFYAEQASSLAYSFVVTGAAWTKVWVDLVMQGEDAQATVQGTFALNGAQQMHIISRQEHLAPRTQSSVVCNGVVNQKAQASYQGTISIVENACKSEARQLNKMIIADDDAQAWSSPELEVLTNDVTCFHGTAVGKLDKQQIVYLQSRGLSIKQAHLLLLRSIFQDNLSFVYDKQVQQQFVERLLAKVV